ncbi:type II toxin-antitoxin system VapC family toxin [Pasteurella atlantica]|uniref:Type II toxin-antitoxin system VapC family toxin n=2 Tax=Pasteurellaceae TaxID=712 RepID=A0ACC6HPI4_9PAST|nr:type II toxin-antitoxin system VapC family toxin [Pasteurella atlantica]MDP8033299.1 type II toxin-antitoxin system VapC family toxin [Pasteurella atlantica]MDP8035151.1 type II toxin-antitoxin system VapC family toxin [Pasteurella atlantica]MDP8037101.1 type II toxin-antitoxin system VapC family toxin [Pasteurella atlantica]MDP8047288.1 type II toxin-antitoxin system VapC family toxin [Pasteurella atlantica]MDP8049488.1 type II toxin-antitoxin system VapC family toxin [Pasteurella atlantic
MITYMLDTNICIYAMNNKPQKVRKKLIQHQKNVCISNITLAELLYGAEKSANRDKAWYAVNAFTENLLILDYDVMAATYTAKIRATLERKGMPIGSYDTMIAGHALSQNIILVTNNQKEFNRVNGLQLDNWI